MTGPRRVLAFLAVALISFALGAATMYLTIADPVSQPTVTSPADPEPQIPPHP